MNTVLSPRARATLAWVRTCKTASKHEGPNGRLPWAREPAVSSSPECSESSEGYESSEFYETSEIYEASESHETSQTPESYESYLDHVSSVSSIDPVTLYYMTRPSPINTPYYPYFHHIYSPVSSNNSALLLALLSPASTTTSQRSQSPQSPCPPPRVDPSKKPTPTSEQRVNQLKRAAGSGLKKPRPSKKPRYPEASCNRYYKALGELLLKRKAKYKAKAARIEEGTQRILQEIEEEKKRIIEAAEREKSAG